MDNKAVAAFTTWAFPGVLSFLMMIMYNDIREMKTDVKALLEQSAGDKVKIEYLQKEIETLKDQISYNNNKDERKEHHTNTLPMYAVLPTNKQDGTYVRPAYPTGV